MMKRPLGIFLAFVALYLYTAGPSLVPFRDAGEMASTVHTLGVLHPPSYPLYTLVGHAWDQLPLGNPAYRLNVFSGISLALAWTLFYVALSVLFGAGSALLTVLLGGLSYHFWMHALVSEMYSFHLLIMAGIFWALVRERWALAAVWMGLGLANRPDLLLCAPAFLLLFQPLQHKPKTKQILGWACLSGAGLLLYMYLPLRALRKPVFNWNNPSTLDAFWGSLTRRGYGGMLDLLSQSYQTGENFLSQALLYSRHLVFDFVFVGVVMAALGGWVLWREKRSWFYAVLVGFLITGPVFIFLGNLPPNPHAVAIMESAYLAPDFFFLIAAAAGASLVLRRAGRGIVLTTAVILACVQAGLVYSSVNHRSDFFAVDFIQNVRRSVPPRAVVIARSDVPIFGLFYERWVDGSRKDWVPLAQALVHTPWYQEQTRYAAPDLWLGPLKTAADWDLFARMNGRRSLYGTLDAEWPQGKTVSHGLLLGWKTDASSVPYLEEFTVRRGDYRYDRYRDFFRPELIEEYAKAWFELGHQAEEEKNIPKALTAYRAALTFKPSLPYVPLQIGFLMTLESRWREADRWYRWAVDSAARQAQATRDWNAPPELREHADHDYAQALVHLGVVQEKLGQTEEAERLYTQALSIYPKNADALYNRSVLYWGKDWAKVVSDLEALAKIAPNDERWPRYLPVAQQKMRTP